MNKFCKIFEVDYGQILVTLLPGEDEAPVIEFTHVTSDGATVSIKTGVGNEDWSKAQTFFDTIDVQRAEPVIQELLSYIVEADEDNV